MSCVKIWAEQSNHGKFCIWGWTFYLPLDGHSITAPSIVSIGGFLCFAGYWPLLESLTERLWVWFAYPKKQQEHQQIRKGYSQDWVGKLSTDRRCLVVEYICLHIVNRGIINPKKELIWMPISYIRREVCFNSLDRLHSNVILFLSIAWVEIGGFFKFPWVHLNLASCRYDKEPGHVLIDDDFNLVKAIWCLVE